MVKYYRPPLRLVKKVKALQEAIKKLEAEIENTKEEMIKCHRYGDHGLMIPDKKFYWTDEQIDPELHDIWFKLFGRIPNYNLYSITNEEYEKRYKIPAPEDWERNRRTKEEKRREEED